ncbi:MAG: UvrB/UvrC motif-containing protein [Puniceicoccales bacterium]|jgi:protein arginine kinase activator|nr:UvrB/UvrC motif-containing protein [Puniceicoccales bacterium]
MESLKCSICGKKAAVQLRQMVNGSEQTIWLCAVCARNYGVFPQNTLPFSVIKNIEAALFSGFNEKEKYCLHCGCTMEFFRKNGYLGCAQCYEDLRGDLLPLLENMQKFLKHIGKSPKKFGPIVKKSTAKKSTDQVSLLKQLQKAIDEERFEDAVKIRDQLRLRTKNEGD